MAENIRLVIWDLDDTFWKGTLSEGACTYVDEHHDIVVELARRGIISSICSRNDFATVKQIFGGEGLWNYFGSPNIDWSATGADVEQLVEEVRLRPSSVLFIDDNPFNRAEAAEAVPGIEVADETVIRHLLDDPRLQGEDDRELKRLNQYKELERRRDDQRAAGANNLDFLRKCEIRVYIETDVEAHIHRALELINHTSQLNFTKKRLPDDPDEARAELRAYFRQWWIQTGLIYVVDPTATTAIAASMPCRAGIRRISNISASRAKYSARASNVSCSTSSVGRRSAVRSACRSRAIQSRRREARRLDRGRAGRAQRQNTASAQTAQCANSSQGR